MEIMMIEINIEELMSTYYELNDFRDLIKKNGLYLKRELWLLEKEIENIAKAIMMIKGKELIQKLSGDNN